MKTLRTLVLITLLSAAAFVAGSWFAHYQKRGWVRLVILSNDVYAIQESATAYSNYVVRDGRFVHSPLSTERTNGLASPGVVRVVTNIPTYDAWPTEPLNITNDPWPTLIVSTLNITNVDMVEQSLIELFGAEQGKAIYRRAMDKARQHQTKP